MGADGRPLKLGGSYPCSSMVSGQTNCGGLKRVIGSTINFRGKHRAE